MRTPHELKFMLNGKLSGEEGKEVESGTYLGSFYMKFKAPANMMNGAVFTPKFPLNKYFKEVIMMPHAFQTPIMVKSLKLTTMLNLLMII